MAKRQMNPEALVGARVKVLEPFDRTYPDEYIIIGHMNEDGTDQYALNGAHGWFAAHFLELV